MKDHKLRFLDGRDSADTVTEWLRSTPNNDLDPEMLKYPTIRILCAYDGEPDAYLPSHIGVILESLALRPGIDAHQYVEAIRTLVKGATLCAADIKAREIYFLATDPGVMKIALEHGFEKIECPVLRMKL